MLLLSYNTLQLGISTLDCIVGPMPMFIYVPHIGGNIIVLHQTFDMIIENKINFSFCGTFSIIISQLFLLH